MTDPDQILANYEGTLAEAQRRGDAIRETLATSQITERSAMDELLSAQPQASRPPQPPRRPDDEDENFGDGGYLR